MNWETLYCPNRHCRHYGKAFKTGQMVKNGSSCGQKQGLCKACGSSVSLRYGTAYYNLEAEPAIFETAVPRLFCIFGLVALLVTQSQDLSAVWEEEVPHLFDQKCDIIKRLPDHFSRPTSKITLHI